MKHIKYFEGFKDKFSNQEIEDNMNDYMLPLTDRGFILDICVNDDVMLCGIEKYDANSFQFSEVKEEVYGLINFIKHNYDIDVEYNRMLTITDNDETGGCTTASEDIDNLSDIKDDDKLYEICLLFKNN